MKLAIVMYITLILPMDLRWEVGMISVYLTIATLTLCYSYGKNQGGNNTSLAGSRNFVVDEIEVFEVIYKE